MNFTPEIQSEIDKYKTKGNPVSLIKLGGNEYIYVGLLREDLASIRDAAMTKTRELIDALTDEQKEDKNAQQDVMAKIEDLEESFILSFGVIHPKMDVPHISKLPVGIAKRLREEIFKLSGENDEASEPVKL